MDKSLLIHTFDIIKLLNQIVRLKTSPERE